MSIRGIAEYLKTRHSTKLHTNDIVEVCYNNIRFRSNITIRFNC